MAPEPGIYTYATTRFNAAGSISFILIFQQIFIYQTGHAGKIFSP
jgi:hypothetical protein